MKKLLLVLLGLAGCAALASAQTKISGTGKCNPKPDTQQAVEAGDRANHTLAVVKNSCTWTTPVEMEGLKSTTYTVTSLADSWGAKSTDRGYVVMEMDNGSAEGTWSYTGGTGKLKGLTGKGTYKGAAAADGFTDQVEGEYTIAAPKAAAPKTKK
jgi:hypothetical protein